MEESVKLKTLTIETPASHQQMWILWILYLIFSTSRYQDP